jgi:hypothetical protein
MASRTAKSSKPGPSRSSEAKESRALPAPQATYEGSAEHKSYPSPVGNPALRSDATKCPSDIPYESAKPALSDAIDLGIQTGLHSKLIEGEFPRYVWGCVTLGNPARDIWFEARLINRALGQYKAWPIDEEHENSHLTEAIRSQLWTR